MADSVQPLSYTANPFLLFFKDLGLFVANIFTWPPNAGGILSIILPLRPTPSGELDELYPSWQNIWAIIVHILLSVAQILFLGSLLPVAFVAPLPPIVYLLYIVGFVFANQYLSALLNGRRKKGLFKSNDKYLQGYPVDKHEKWVFINGVAVGKHWLQANLDRLALTFRRPIYGIHNQTRGVLFDVLECIIQRDFAYATLDIRQAYSALLAILTDPNIHKVVLIVHSQGAIEGGLVLDWLYATVAADQLSKLEVYTFGNAANHWNAPASTLSALAGDPEEKSEKSQAKDSGTEAVGTRPPPSDKERSDRIVRYIEHYANTYDYVARGGILNFRRDPPPPESAPGPSETRQASPTASPAASDTNRFVGRLFKRTGSGHQLNQHYLDNFFKIDSTDPLTGEVIEANEYMNSLVDMDVFEHWDTVQTSNAEGTGTDGTMIKDLSRLWMYRNGGDPDSQTEPALA